MVGKALSRLVIEDLAPDDVAEVLAIETVSYTTPWSEILFMNEIFKPGSMPKVARLGEKIIGYICSNHVLDEGHILNVTVHPEHRRQGIAAGLVKHMLGILGEKGCRVVFLEVRISNEAALGMYGKTGFRAIATRKRYYTSPDEDAVVMSLNIS
jgi:ribosomal-protein-alanine N-acetyltransferase